ncbi:MAG: 30S ribosomal protein S6 [Nitrospinae bacterium]|nr:30S ribosomal protein S6 [Nitrospinota bacterium]
MTNDYESIFIVRPDLSDEDIEKELAAVRSLIEGEGGSIISEDKWGKRRLGYPIRKHRYGYYDVLRYTVDSGAVTKVDRHFRLNENIVKSMTVLFDGSAGRYAVADKPAAAEAAVEETGAQENGES